MASARKRIWGWFFFDWASQPYNTLILTFIFGPYVADLLGDGTKAQSAWGYGIAAAGLLIAISAPILGAIADRAGKRMPFIWVFSGMYVLGAYGLWWSDPADFSLTLILISFAIGLIGMEFATIFTNSMLPELGTREEIGGISGSGWAFGYLGGLLALVILLLFFAENADSGKTMLGISPVFGLDAAAREGTRAVGPFTAIWFVVFMVPFFLWVRDPRKRGALTIRQAVGSALPELNQTLRSLPKTPSLLNYLISSMFYRDALNGMYVFGGIYAAGVLGWGTTDRGIFGIVAIITGALFAWLGGRADNKFGPKPVIMTCVLTLTGIALAVVFVSRESLFGIALAPGSILPDVAFYILGAGIGAAGGALQSASRTMMVRQARPDRMTEAFGLYALAGKATSFLAPFLIAVTTDLTNSQQMGISPLVALFLIGFVLLFLVKPDGDRAKQWSDPSSPFS